jgi:hypothetical protein
LLLPDDRENQPVGAIGERLANDGLLLLAALQQRIVVDRVAITAFRKTASAEGSNMSRIASTSAELISVRSRFEEMRMMCSMSWSMAGVGSR